MYIMSLRCTTPLIREITLAGIYDVIQCNYQVPRRYAEIFDISNIIQISIGNVWLKSHINTKFYYLIPKFLQFYRFDEQF